MITQEQRQLRQQYIGSSDAAAVCGIDPHRSAADVWMEKTGQAEPFEGNEHTERGNLLEPVVLDWAEKEIGVGFSRDHMKVAECGLLAANFDGIHRDPLSLLSRLNPFVVEAKTTVNAEEWGEAGTDQVPERVIVQVHHQLYVAGQEYRIGYVPVLMPGFKSFDFRMYRVERDDDLAEAIAAKGREFMEKYVRLGIRPDDFRPSIEVLKRVRRQPNKTVEVPDDLVDQLVVARAAKSLAEKDVKDAEAALLAALGDAEAGSYAKGTVTYMETKRRGYTVEDTTYRTLRVKPAKEPK